MRKFTVAFVVFIVVVVTFYGIWLQFPKARNTEVVAEAYKVTNERLNEMLAQADDPELNGFLNPYFVPYWGRRSIEQKEGSPASQTIMAWGEYSTPYQGEKVDHKTLQSEGDEGYSKALADMEKAVPELREAMNKPLFMPPKFELTAEAEVPNYIAARACAQTMVGLAEAEVTQGKDQQAARDLVSVIHFGSNFNGQGTLISDMIGIAIQAIGLNAFNGLIDLNSDFPAEEWKSLTKTILDSTPPKDSMIRAFQGEMVFCGNSVDGLADNAGDFQEDAWMTALPGFLGRELRIYNNLMSDQILSLQKNGSLNLPKELLEPTAMDRFTGRSGPLAEILIPSGERSIAHTNLSRRCLIAIATATGMAAYRAQEGKLPASLAQLSEAGIPVTDEKEWLEAMEYKVQGDTATLKIRVQDPPAELTPMSGTDWEHPWLEASNEFLVYKFEPLKK